MVYIELPEGYKPSDIDISSIRLEGTIPAEVRPYAIGDNDKDGIPDLMVKFNRSDVINALPRRREGDRACDGEGGISDIRRSGYYQSDTVRYPVISFSIIFEREGRVNLLSLFVFIPFWIFSFSFGILHQRSSLSAQGSRPQ